MPGALLDTHTLYWLVTAAGTLSEEALVAIADGQSSGTLYVSPITAWELTIASRKPAHKDPPNLGTGTPSKWFSAAVAATGAKDCPHQAAYSLRGSCCNSRYRPQGPR